MKYLKIAYLLAISCMMLSTKVVAQSPSLDGAWQQVGYGKFLSIQDSIIQVYDYNRVECHLSEEWFLPDICCLKTLTEHSLVIQHGLNDRRYARIAALPVNCVDRLEQLPTDPEANFESFWHTMNEHYCSFDLKAINWQEVYEEYRPQVTSETTELELLVILKAIISSLEDSHLSLDLPDHLAKEYKSTRKKKSNRYRTLAQFEIAEGLASLYVDSLRTHNSGLLRWGLIKDEIGYIQLNAMLMLADYGLDENLNLGEFFQQYWQHAGDIPGDLQRQQEIDACNKLLNQILEELPEAKAWILDLRFNGGGKDPVAMNLVSHFSALDQKVASKKTRFRAEFNNELDLLISPSDTSFVGPVYVLTSLRSASAAESAVLYTMPDPKFVRIGSNTEGIFSDTLDKSLPNGWTYTLSNEIYLDLEGNNYEHFGIPPHHELNYPREKDAFFEGLEKELDAGKDRAIDLVIDLHFEE